MSGITVGDALRKRLQLSLGMQATFGEEIPSNGAGRAFAAVSRENGQDVIVTVHRSHPDGPDPALMRRRLAELRHLAHGVIDLPLADGELDGKCWVVDAVTPYPAAREQISAMRLTVPHAVSALRDLARALTAMHRLSITHGAIDLESVRITPEGARLGRLGHSLGGTIRADLDALGFVAWSLLSGEVEHGAAQPLSLIRRGVPKPLDELCQSFCARSPAARPQRAEDVLDALDVIPTRPRNPLTSIVDVGLHDVRPRRALGLVVVGAVAVFLVLMYGLRL